MKRHLLGALSLAVLLAASACGAGGSEPSAARGVSVDAGDWASVLAQAKGQTVSWHMYGGDDALNTFVNGYVADRLKTYGVRLNQVKITDTADAINAVLGEQQAGRTTGGSVDAIWVNGENFGTGVQAGLWSCGWPSKLPNAKYVDLSAPAVANDFGVPVNDCESVWQQAGSALVYDSAKLQDADVASVSSLLAWAARNPGRFTYPAPPDFTGSMAVRTILYDTIGGARSLAGAFDAKAYAPAARRLWTRLNGAEKTLWRRGSTYPQSQGQVEKLYASGEISAYFTYGPGAVGDQVAKKVFPATTREAVLAGGNIANSSFIGVPANAAHRAAALVLANVLLEPATQLELYRAEGTYPGIDLTRVPPDVRARFAAVPVSPSVLPLERLRVDAQPELASGYVTRLEKDWTANVLQR